MTDASELILYESLVKNRMLGYEDTLIHRIALHKMRTVSSNVHFKRQRHLFRIAYKIEDDCGWCISCMGGKRYFDDSRAVYCGGMQIGKGTFLEAIQWLIDGES